MITDTLRNMLKIVQLKATELGISYNQIAKETGIAPKTVSDYLSIATVDGNTYADAPVTNINEKTVYKIYKYIRDCQYHLGFEYLSKDKFAEQLMEIYHHFTNPDLEGLSKAQLCSHIDLSESDFDNILKRKKKLTVEYEYFIFDKCLKLCLSDTGNLLEKHLEVGMKIHRLLGMEFEENIYI